MKLPLNAMADAFMSRLRTRRDANREVRLSILVDVHTDAQTVREIREAFIPQVSQVRLHVEGYGADRSLPPANSLSDAAILIVARETEAAAALFGTFHTLGVPCLVVVACENPEASHVCGHQLTDRGVPLTRMVHVTSTTVCNVLAQWLVGTCKDAASSLSAAFPVCQRAFVRSIVQDAVISNALVAFVPFFDRADMPLMFANELRMAARLGAVRGVPFDLRRVAEVGIIGSCGILLRLVSRSAGKAAPVLAPVIRPVVAAGGTYAMGRFLDAYYATIQDEILLSQPVSVRIEPLLSDPV